MQTITTDGMEQAYCFIHQKWRVYEHSSMDWQKDDIEYAIAQYAGSMGKPLYQALACGKPVFLTDHATFAADMRHALARLERMMHGGA